RRPPQASKGIPCGLLHNEATGDIRSLHQNEGVPILPRRSSEGLAVSSASAFQHLGRYEMHIFGEVLSGIQNRIHQEGDMWDKAAYWRDFARVLGKYFYEGLSMMDKSMIDAASGGALMDKTLAAARHLISNMSSNIQQFGIRRDQGYRKKKLHAIKQAFLERLCLGAEPRKVRTLTPPSRTWSNCSIPEILIKEESKGSTPESLE
ncbi:hypothetical protein CR513_62513, partial [Mucuna pruriens]